MGAYIWAGGDSGRLGGALSRFSKKCKKSPQSSQKSTYLPRWVSFFFFRPPAVVEIRGGFSVISAAKLAAWSPGGVSRMVCRFQPAKTKRRPRGNFFHCGADVPGGSSTGACLSKGSAQAVGQVPRRTARQSMPLATLARKS